MRIKEKFTKKLLVEGNDDQHVVWASCAKFTVDESFDVIDCEGIDSLFNQIPVRIKQSGTQTIGIIIDADSNIATRWTKLSRILNSLGYETPQAFPNEGLILNFNNIKIGVWIMPNNSLNGMIEDFISFLIPENDNLLITANNTLDDIERREINNYNIIHRSKALIHSWLSWQEDPGTPMGASITKRYLTTDSILCNQFIAWLNNLFE